MKQSIESVVWAKGGRLRKLNPQPAIAKKRKADVAVIIVGRNRPDLTDSLVKQIRGMSKNLSVDRYIIEMGSDSDKRSKFNHFHYRDINYRGKCYGHNVGLRWARAFATHKYYWILMNDLVFNDTKALEKLVQVSEDNPSIGILSPTEPKSSYIGCKPKKNSDCRLVTTCDYLSLFIKAEVINKVGFLNPNFKYCWGAIHEYAYKLYSNNYHIAYCDKVTMRHLGGTTYGKDKNLPSRVTYKKNASKFAREYFVKKYGKNWDRRFSKVLPKGVQVNAFPTHKRMWENM